MDPTSKLKKTLTNRQFFPAESLPWQEGSLPAGVVLLYPDGRSTLIGHDIQGSTSAHFVGGIPWRDEINSHPGIQWAWVFE